MNTQYKSRTTTEPISVPTISTVLGASRAPRWWVPLGAAVLIAVAVASSHEFRSAESATAKQGATVHAANAVPLIGPEEQAFIDRVRHTQVASVGGRVAIKPSKAEPLVGPEEQAYINRVRHAPVGSISSTAVVAPSTVQRLIGPEEQAFINRLHARLASIVRMPVVVTRFAPMAS